jgi:hypothetical protein
MHEGVVYRTKDADKGPIPMKPLHASLFGEMDTLLAGQATIQMDQSFISQTLFKLLYPCESNQDMRDALPECLVSLIDELHPLPRQREPAYTIAGDQRALRQYEKMLPQIELYVAMKMLF